MSVSGTATPVEIGRANQHDVKIAWQDGHESIYPARALRLACPCAACVDPSTRPSTSSGLAQDSAPQASPSGLRETTIHPVKIDLVGRYAIAIHWSDGHNTGIYAFDYLRKRCPCCHAPPN
jgi:DUF971 family protein